MRAELADPLGGGWQPPVPVHLAINILPTVIFVIAMVWNGWHWRHLRPAGVGTRALNAAFGGAGLAALSTTIIFGVVSIREHSLMLWLFHPTMVAVVQGWCGTLPLPSASAAGWGWCHSAGSRARS